MRRRDWLQNEGERADLAFYVGISTTLRAASLHRLNFYTRKKYGNSFFACFHFSSNHGGCVGMPCVADTSPIAAQKNLDGLHWTMTDMPRKFGRLRTSTTHTHHMISTINRFFGGDERHGDVAMKKASGAKARTPTHASFIL